MDDLSSVYPCNHSKGIQVAISCENLASGVICSTNSSPAHRVSTLSRAKAHMPSLSGQMITGA